MCREKVSRWAQRVIAAGSPLYKEAIFCARQSSNTNNDQQ